MFHTFPPFMNFIFFVFVLMPRILFCKYRGGISFITGGSFSTSWRSWMWKMSSIKLPCPRTWNNIKKIFFNIPWRKLGKNVNLFHLNINFFLSQTEKVSRFLNAGIFYWWIYWGWIELSKHRYLAMKRR